MPTYEDMLPEDLYIDRESPEEWTEEAISDVIGLAKYLWSIPRVASVFRRDGEDRVNGLLRELTDDERGFIDVFTFEYFQSQNRHRPDYYSKGWHLIFRWVAGKLGDFDSLQVREYILSKPTGYTSKSNLGR